MSKHIIVVESTKDWKGLLPDDLMISAHDYIRSQSIQSNETIKITNLCRSYRYLSVGYYVSLLAEARDYLVIPSVKTALELSKKAIYQMGTDGLDDDLQKQLRHRNEEKIRFDIYFGHADMAGMQDLADELFERFPCPVLEVELRCNGKWHIHYVGSGKPSALDTPEREKFVAALNVYLGKRWRAPKAPTISRYDMALLHKADDKLSPSNEKALKNFIKAGKRLGVEVDLINRHDYSSLSEYDALFIRETTSVNHYTFRFAKKAEAEGLVVIDDPTSIMRCTNKVYLAELLRTNKINTPRTVVLQKDQPLELGELEFPMVLKIPDGAFSLGVYKAKDPEEFREITTRLFKQSDLILAQEFLYTDFDWRIGILNRQPIYACRYFMSKSHWQIVQHKEGGGYSLGDAQTILVEDAPPAVLKTALKAANLIGDGLYGVDLKQNDKGVYVIEVNDNPNIDAGIEDLVLKDRLYSIVMEDFVRRIEESRKMA